MREQISAMNETHHHAQFHPSPWVVRFLERAPTAGTVLDLACGSGRHGRLCHAAGHPVLMLDRDISGVTDMMQLQGVEVMQADLEGGNRWPLGKRRFDVLIVTNYLHRPLIPHILAAVAPGGLLIYETFAAGNAKYGGPGNPDYLLEKGELLRAMPPEFEVLAFEDVELQEPRPAVVQRIAACRQA